MKIWKREYYEKLMANLPPGKTVQGYQAEIQEAQKNIEELQSKCAHPEYEVVFYSWRPGAMQPAHICKDCAKCLGDATSEESQKMWDDYNRDIQAKINELEVFKNKTVKK